MAEHPESDAARYVLMGLIDAEDPGLVILPNHRLVRADAPADLVERLSERFEVTDLTSELPDGVEGATALLARVRERAGGPSTFGVLDASGRKLLATGRSFESLAEAMPDGLSEASQRLDALVLTELILDPLFGIDAAALTAGAVDFVANIDEAQDGVADGPYSVAFLVNGTPVQQVIEVADAAEVMPQKTTFFYPKLATGMVFSLLDD
jgi:flavin-binding protein dodecin